jgi:ATP-dependent DNA helicase RecQ
VHDIVQALGKEAPFVADSSLVRQNVGLSFYAGRGEVQKRAFFDVMRRVARPAIVLCNSPREVEAVHGALGAMGLTAHRYHEELRPGVRAGEQLSFSMGDRAVLVATSAFAPGGGGTDSDPEAVPGRYGRRTTKNDVRSLVRFDPPASIEQLVDEMSLVSRDGHAGEVVVFYDPSDRPRLQADLERARPSGEHFLSFGKAIEASFDREGSVTVEAMALAARSTRRAIESVAELLCAMGLLSTRDGWIRFVGNEPTLSRELRSIAERLATVRALDARRLADLELLGTHAACGTAELRRFLGESDPPTCGACVVCRGLSRDAQLVPAGPRHAPARRFTVTAHGEAPGASTFHTDSRSHVANPLTAKLADFR